MHLPLRTVKFFLTEFEKNLSNYTLKTYTIDELRKVVILEDTLILYIGIEKNSSPICDNVKKMYEWTLNNEFVDMPNHKDTYYDLYIEELTNNTLGFKHNHSKFIRDMEAITEIKYLSLSITYKRFKGYTRPYWCLEEQTLAEEINLLLPQLKLRERYEQWEGVTYNIIIAKLESIYEQTEYAVAYTKQNAKKYIRTKSSDWILGGEIYGEIRTKERRFQKAFASWKNSKKELFTNNKLQFFYFEKNFREKNDVWQFCDTILEGIYNETFFIEEFEKYTPNIKKYISEKKLYSIIKNQYNYLNVVYNHKPFFLRTLNGKQMSYDVFITGLNIAIEFKGREHFNPYISYGGIKAFENRVLKDKEKLRLSNKNNINLVYINYWESITPKLIKLKLDYLIKMKNL